MEKIEPNIELRSENFAHHNESVTQKDNPDGSFVTRFYFEGEIYLKKDLIDKLEKQWKDRWILLDGNRYNFHKPLYNIKELEKNGSALVRMIMERTVGG